MGKDKINKIDFFIKSKKALIICLIIIFGIICISPFVSQEKEPVKQAPAKFDYAYMSHTMSADDIINNSVTLDETEEDIEKLESWVKDLRDKKVEGLKTLNTSKHTYIYFGATCNEDEVLGFTYGDAMQDDETITFNISANKYKSDDSKNEHTYANTIFYIEKTDKQIKIS